MEMKIKGEYGTVYIYVARKRDKIHVSIDSCQVELTPKQAKQFADALKNAVLDNKKDGNDEV